METANILVLLSGAILIEQALKQLASIQKHLQQPSMVYNKA
jgi:cell division septal protein FtsQ